MNISYEDQYDNKQFQDSYNEFHCDDYDLYREIDFEIEEVKLEPKREFPFRHLIPLKILYGNFNKGNQDEYR